MKFDRNIVKIGHGKNLAVLVFVSVIASSALADTIALQYGGATSEIAGPLCSASGSGTAYWSDGLAPHSDADYVSTKQFRTPISNDGTEWEFEGNSIDCKNTVFIKTLLPSKLKFRNEFRCSTYFALQNNQNLVGAADFTAELFKFHKVNIYPCPNTAYQGGVYLHGAFSSDIGTDGNSSKYVQIIGTPSGGSASRPDTFVDFDGDATAWYARVMAENATITGKYGFPNANYIELRKNSTIVVKDTGFAANCLRTGSAAAAKIIFDSSSGALGTLTLTGATSFNATSTLTLMVTNLLALSAGGTFDLVKSDRAISSKIVLDPAVTNSFPSATCESVSEGGFYYIRLTVASWPHVSLTQSANGYTKSSVDIAAITNGSVWSDGLSPSGGKNYYAGSVKSGTTYIRTPYTSSNPPEHPVFAGASLLLDDNVWLAQCQRNFHVTNLICLAGSTISFLLPEFNCSLSGGMSILGQTSMIAWNNRTATIASEISGPGDLRLQILSPYATSAPWAYYSLTGLNTNFSGRIVVNMQATNATYPDNSHCNTLYISDKRNLGGSCGSFRYDALQLAHMSKLSPSVDGIVLDEPTRGIYINGCGRFSVAAGRALTVRQPITYNGTMRKEGDGHLAIGGRARFTLANADDGSGPVADKNVFEVVAGSVQVLSTNALDGVAVSFAEGAQLVIDPSADDPDVVKYGLCSIAEGGGITLPEGGLTFAVKAGSENAVEPGDTCAIVTVPTAAAEALRDRIAPASARYGKKRMVVEERPNDGEGTVTFYAEFYVNGMSLILR